MTETTSTALQTARAYYDAWTSHDFDLAMTFVADDVSCDAPPGRLEGATAFRDFMEPFSRSVSRSELLAAFGDDSTALLMYDTETAAVPHAPGAELLTVSAGTITHVKIIFDRAPFIAARQAGQAG